MATLEMLELNRSNSIDAPFSSRRWKPLVTSTAFREVRTRSMSRATPAVMLLPMVASSGVFDENKLTMYVEPTAILVLSSMYSSSPSLNWNWADTPGSGARSRSKSTLTVGRWAVAVSMSPDVEFESADACKPSVIWLKAVWVTFCTRSWTSLVYFVNALVELSLKLREAVKPPLMWHDSQVISTPRPAVVKLVVFVDVGGLETQVSQGMEQGRETKHTAPA